MQFDESEMIPRDLESDHVFKLLRTLQSRFASANVPEFHSITLPFSFGSEGTEFPPPALSATFEQLGFLKHEPTASLR